MRIDEFILARVTEDEALARAALGEPKYPAWGDTAHEECVEIASNEGCADEGVNFVREMTPARALAQAAAFRAIVDEHDLHAWLGVFVCDTCGTGRPSGCPTLEAVASIWSEHEDYAEEWRMV